MGIDDFFGFMDFISKGTGALQILTRTSKARNKHKASPREMVRVVHPRPSVDPDIEMFRVVNRHMNKHGITLYKYEYDSKNVYFQVPKRQYAWFLKLYNNGNLWAPASSWKESAKAKGKRK